MGLHKFVEKVAVFMVAKNENTEIPDDVADVLFRYATIVADQGLFAPAAKYCR